MPLVSSFRRIVVLSWKQNGWNHAVCWPFWCFVAWHLLAQRHFSRHVITIMSARCLAFQHFAADTHLRMLGNKEESCDFDSLWLRMFRRQHGPARKTAAAYRLPAQKVQESQLFSHCSSHWGPSSRWPNWIMLIQTSQRMSRSLRMGYRWKIGVEDLALLWHLFFCKKQLCNTLLGAPVRHLLPGSGRFQAVLCRWCVVFHLASLDWEEPSNILAFYPARMPRHMMVGWPGQIWWKQVTSGRMWGQPLTPQGGRTAGLGMGESWICRLTNFLMKKGSWCFFSGSAVGKHTELQAAQEKASTNWAYRLHCALESHHRPLFTVPVYLGPSLLMQVV